MKKTSKHLIKTGLLILLQAAVVFPALANDRAIEGSGGSFRVMKKEDPNISMESEKITMDIYPDYYDVVAEFTFKNHSKKPVTVMMGFPEHNHGDVDMAHLEKVSGFVKFKTSVDGQKLKVSQRKIVSREEWQLTAHWIKEVPFKPLQTRKVKVEYRSKMGQAALPGIFAEYEFTGGNWKGMVKESKLEARLHLPAAYSVLFDEYATPKEVIKLGNKLYFNRKNWDAEYFLMLMFNKK